jgi:hypothetical protein
MIERLKPLADRIRENRDRLAENASEIRKAGGVTAGLEEGSLILSVEKSTPSFTVCAVDGGLLTDRFVGSDILVSRAVAACFTYESGRLASVRYHPKKFPEPEVGFRNGLDEHEALVFRSLFRLKGELSTALESLEMFKPDYLFLDGSVVPLGADKPADGSALSEDYEGLLKVYKTLYGRCGETGCQLVGVIKDSRGKRLAEILKDRLMVEVPDATLADALLREGERTSEMAYSHDHSRHQVLRQLGDWGEKIRLFYLKPSASDMPLRVEFVRPGKSASEIASAVLSLSSISKAFAYPAALIEADMCAALAPLEMEKIKRSLIVLTGGASRPLRRSDRPFR